MMVLSSPPSYFLTSVISQYLSGLIHEDSRIGENLLHGKQARQVVFFTLWTTTMKEVALDHA